MKKVLFTATVDSHILQFHLPFLKYFKENGYEVHVATNGDEKIPYCDKKIKISFERSPFKLNNLKSIKELKKVVESEKYDIIHTHTPMGSVVTRLASKKARKKGTRVIYTAHGFHFFKGAPILNWLLFYPVEKYLAKYTDTLITINKEDYNLAKRKLKRCKHIEYVSGVGIDDNKFNFEMTEQEKSKLRKSLDLNDDDFVMIYPAELNKNKNQIMLINAMEELVKKHKSIKLLLPGKDSYNGFYQNLTIEKGLDKYIKFLGFRSDIPKLLKISNLAVATSKREGLPVNLLEAMYVGLPIVATNCRGQRDLVKDEINGYLVDLHDQDGFTNSIEKIYLANDKCNKFSQESSQMIKEYLLFDIMQKMSKIYGVNNQVKVLQCLVCTNIGGAETLVMNLYRNIDRDKLQFDFLTCLDGVFDKEIKELGGTINHIKYYKKTGIIKYYFSLKKFFKESNYKIIHIHMDCMNGIVARAAKKSKKNIITISHSHSTGNSGNKLVVFYKKILKKFVNKNADYKFACSKESAEWLYGKESSNATIIPNGIDIDKFKYNDSLNREIRKKYNINNDAVVIGHVGRFEVVKNHTFLIKIFDYYHKNINDNSKLLLVGDGSLKNDISNLASSLGLEKDVIFVGNVMDVYKYYNAMNIFVFPSNYEGLPLTLVEAQANGLPIILTSNISKEIILSSNIIKKDLNSGEEDWAKTISLLKRNSTYDKKIVKYDICKISKDIEEIYLTINKNL